MRRFERAFVTMSIAGALAVAVSPRTSRAQPRALSTLSHPSLLARFSAQVRAAEAAGAAYPRSRGTAQSNPRRCVDASGTRYADSGEFQAGPFVDYPEIWGQGKGKLWWKPATVVEGETLLVRARSLDHPKVVQDYRLSDIAYPVALGMVRKDRPFYPSHIRLPSTGAWLLVASVGKNWGCFLLQLF